MTQVRLNNPSAFDTEVEAIFAARSAPNETQAAAFDRFADLRLPHRRIEGWRWSDFNAALRAGSAAEKEEIFPITPSDFAALDPYEIQIVDGRIQLPDEQAPDSVSIGIIESMATIAELESHAIASLNVAMNRKALGLQVDEGAEVKRPVLIRHIRTRAAPAFCQMLMRVGVGASLEMIEMFEGESAALYSHLCHAALRDNARLTRTVSHKTGAASVTHSLFAAKIDSGAHLDQTMVSTGARLARHETLVHYVGEVASSNLRSAALLKDARHNDVTATIAHKAPGCKTRQIHKGVARDAARNVFQGKFLVERAGQKTDAQMTANALLLSDRAEANHKPELEIYADDVECAHGSTVGALDENALFYMRQRGLSEKQARALLIEAFVGEAIDGVSSETLRSILASHIADWLEAA